MIIITGASRGLGAELAKHFAEHEKVVGFYNKTAPQNPGKIEFAQVDVTNHKQVQDWSSVACKDQKQIKLICCAGINYNSLLHKSEPEMWANVIGVNLIGTYNIIREVLPFMRESGFGRIVTVSSVVPQLGVPGTTAYAASKAGLWGLTKSLSKELRGKDITINNVNLGYFDAGMINEVPTEIQAQVKKTIPKERFGKPDELRDLIEYIFKAPYTNGTSFDINGGLF